MNFDWNKVSWTKPRYTKENIIVGILAIVVGGGIWAYSNHQSHSNSLTHNIGADSNSSLSAIGSALAGTSASKWVLFRDPNEGAFTINVPSGWKVRGGTVRAGSVDVRHAVEAISPDNSIVLFYGDTNVPVYTMPNVATQMAGMPEGAVLPYAGASMVIARYQSGDVFASNWGSQRVSSYCSNAKLRASHQRPDSSHDLSQLVGNTVQVNVNAGEAIFTCSMNGKRSVGYTFAATLASQAAGAGIWVMYNGEGFVASADKYKEAGALLSKMAGSFALDPQWEARQQKTTTATSEINTQTNNAISKSIRDSFEYSQRRDASIDSFDRAIRGVDLFNDPLDGQVELEDKKHQYRTDTGGRFGTDLETDPPTGSQELQRARH